jgi:hypothetical protein
MNPFGRAKAASLPSATRRFGADSRKQGSSSFNRAAGVGASSGTVGEIGEPMIEASGYRDAYTACNGSLLPIGGAVGDRYSEKPLPPQPPSRTNTNEYPVRTGGHVGPPGKATMYAAADAALARFPAVPKPSAQHRHQPYQQHQARIPQPPAVYNVMPPPPPRIPPPPAANPPAPAQRPLNLQRHADNLLPVFAFHGPDSDVSDDERADGKHVARIPFPRAGQDTAAGATQVQSLGVASRSAAARPLRTQPPQQQPPGRHAREPSVGVNSDTIW